MARECKTDSKKLTMQDPGCVLNATISRSIDTWYYISRSLTMREYVASFKSCRVYIYVQDMPVSYHTYDRRMSIGAFICFCVV